jgi:hypothetical protein
MIKGKIVQVKDSISKFQDAQKALSQSNTYNEFYESLKLVDITVKKCFDVYRVLVSYDKDKFGNLEFKEMIYKIETMSKVLSNGEILKKTQILNFVQLIEDQGNALKEQWAVYAIDKSNGVLSILKSIKGLFDDKTKITNMILRLDNAKNKWPVDDNYIKGFEKDIEDGKALISELNAGQDIRRFLTLVAMEQATINDINEDILKWINERNFASRIKLSFIT